MSEMTTNEFETILLRLLEEKGAYEIMSVPGVLEALSNYWNIEIHNIWAKEQKEKNNAKNKRN